MCVQQRHVDATDCIKKTFVLDIGRSEHPDISNCPFAALNQFADFAIKRSFSRDMRRPEQPDSPPIARPVASLDNVAQHGQQRRDPDASSEENGRPVPFHRVDGKRSDRWQCLDLVAFTQCVQER
ncbi:hypothetical protein D3C71_1522060 [compost metagenome]